MIRPSRILRRIEDALLARFGVVDSDERRCARLRSRGVRIGVGCRIYTTRFSTEPYLVEIGNHVGIAGGVELITHDGVAFMLRETEPEAQVFGRITIGDHSLIGQNSVILPGTTIGTRCVIGAGSVVKGVVPDNSVYAGVPARLIGSTEALLEKLRASPGRLDIWSLRGPEREARLRRHFGIPT